MKLYVLDLGKIVMTGDNPVTCSDKNDEAPAIPVSAFLLDTPVGKILFDSGCHPEAMTGAWPEEMCTNPYVCGEDSTLLRRLGQINIKPEEIRYIVESHLHLDHAGGIHLFPNAEVYVQEDELAMTMKDWENDDLDIFHMKCDIENWISAKVKWKPVKSDGLVELCKGVSVIDLKGGHSFGMLAVKADLKSGSVLLVSDAAYSAFHYGPPAKPSGAIYDEAGYFDAIEKIRVLEKEYNAKVIFGHDMAQFNELIKSNEGCYE